MIQLQINLSTWLNQNLGNLNASRCPIQEGTYKLLVTGQTILIWAAAIAFLIGMVLAVFYYLTAYGDEAKAKKAKDTFKWTILGAVVVMLAYYILGMIALNLISSNQGITDIEQEQHNCQTKPNAPTGQEVR